ncbi:MAG TPA: transcriptional regulator [Candidatus Angelobacter sp.]|jgi:DNA-binding transcriptional ArsR family regulator
MSTTLQELAALDRVIHEPARLMILTVLYAVSEADFLYLQNECGLTQGNLSSHLSKLEQARYVTVEKTFKGKYPLTICRLMPQGRKAFEGYARIMQAATDVVGRKKH